MTAQSCMVTIPDYGLLKEPDARWQRVLAVMPYLPHVPGALTDACIDIGLCPVWNPDFPVLPQRDTAATRLPQLMDLWINNRPGYAPLIYDALAGESSFAVEMGLDRASWALFQLLFMDISSRLEDENWVREEVYVPALCNPNTCKYNVLSAMFAREYGTRWHKDPANDSSEESEICRRYLSLSVMLLIHVPGVDQARALIEAILGPVEQSRFARMARDRNASQTVKDRCEGTPVDHIRETS